MTALSEAAGAVAATRYAAARDHLQQAYTCTEEADGAMRRETPVPFDALDSIRYARRHLDRAEAAIRMGMAAGARRDADQ